MTSLDAAGVNYQDLDEFKLVASHWAKLTAGFHHIGRGWKELEWTRGESAYAMQNEDTGTIIAVVIEGLGTKNLVAEDPVYADKPGHEYRSLAQDNVAMVVNDMITIGVLPLIFMLHPALAEGDHLKNVRGQKLAAGTYATMRDHDIVWGPGETPELNGIIVPGTMCLSGAAVGFADSDKFLINPVNIRAGQRIVLLGSSGIHANGLSRARKIAATLPDGYRTVMDNKQEFGDALLTPTTVYVSFMRHCQKLEIPIAYAMNMTGHGWRKIMRAKQPFTYRMQQVPKPHEVFRFMQKHGGISNEDAYKAFNMGAGFCLIVDEEYVPKIQTLGRSVDIPVLDAGIVEEGPRQVIIEPLNLTFDELSIR